MGGTWRISGPEGMQCSILYTLNHPLIQIGVSSTVVCTSPDMPGRQAHYGAFSHESTARKTPMTWYKARKSP